MSAGKPSKTADELKSVFVISPIGKRDEDGFDFTRLVLEEIVRPAARAAGGFSDPVRGDEVRAPGSITAKIVTQILDADVCIADLTGRNPNVMYEVAIAHAADKPVILLQQEEGGPPFDFADERAIHYSVRADKANRAREDLTLHLQNAFEDHEDDRLTRTLHPVRVLFKELRTRAEASKPEQAMLDQIAALGDQLSAVQRDLRGTSHGSFPITTQRTPNLDHLQLRRWAKDAPDDPALTHALEEYERLLALLPDRRRREVQNEVRVRAGKLLRMEPTGDRVRELIRVLNSINSYFRHRYGEMDGPDGPALFTAE